MMRMDRLVFEKSHRLMSRVSKSYANLLEREVQRELLLHLVHRHERDVRRERLLEESLFKFISEDQSRENHRGR